MYKYIIYLLVITLLIPSFAFAEEGFIDDEDEYYEEGYFDEENADIIDYSNDEIDMNYPKSVEEAVEQANKEIENLTGEIITDYYDVSKVNKEMWDEYGVLVYGSPHGDKKGDENRYVGYTPDGQPFGNTMFPHDEWGGGTYDSRNWIANPWDNPITQEKGATYSPFNGNEDYTENMLAGLEMYAPEYTDRSRTDWHKYMQILQPPTDNTPGQAMMWHQDSNGKIWYVTLPLPSNNDSNIIITDDPEDELIPEPVPLVYNPLRSPNVAVKWDTVPIKVSKSSTTTGKIQRDPITSWNQYKYTVTSWYPNDTTGSIVATNVIRNVPFSNNMFLRGSNEWFTDAKASYTVPSTAKPGTVLIVKLDVDKRIDQADKFPSMPAKPKKPSKPSKPGKNASSAAKARYRARMETYRRKMEEYRLKMEDWNKLNDARNNYLQKLDYQPSIISASGYNYSEYRNHHENLNSFVNSNLRRYVSVEGTAVKQYWFTKNTIKGQAESKNSVVHNVTEPGAGGIDPSIIIIP